jgi:vacuolar-type H+-ATPase subunit I/STV1
MPTSADRDARLAERDERMEAVHFRSEVMRQLAEVRKQADERDKVLHARVDHQGNWLKEVDTRQKNTQQLITQTLLPMMKQLNKGTSQVTETVNALREEMKRAEQERKAQSQAWLEAQQQYHRDQRELMASVTTLSSALLDLSVKHESDHHSQRESLQAHAKRESILTKVGLYLSGTVIGLVMVFSAGVYAIIEYGADAVKDWVVALLQR